MLAPFLIFYFFACLPHFNVSDHQTNLNIKSKITSKHNMQFLNEGFFLWRENKIQTHMALCEKVFAPHPLLKHNCGLSHLSLVSLATPRPDYCHTCSQSRNHLNRTCLTKWSRPKDPQKLHHVEIQRNSVTNEKESNWDLSVWKRL